MGARSGNSYLSAIRKLGAQVWHGDKRIEDPSVAPGFVQPARAIASLYDLQMEFPEALTFRVAERNRAGLSFLQPRSLDELRRKGGMFTRWAEYNFGMMNYSPDAANCVITSMCGAADSLAAIESRFADNVRSYYIAARDNDWCSTIALPGLLAPLRLEPCENGVVLRGIMNALGGPFTEELLGFYSPHLYSGRGEDRSIIFSINSNAPGLKFFCPSSPEFSRSRFDAPLKSRFAMIESMAIFDRVLVPAERVFFFGGAEQYRTTMGAMDVRSALLHWCAARGVVEAGFLAGVVMKLAMVFGSASVFDEEFGELMSGFNQMRSLLQSAEHEAVADPRGQFLPALTHLKASLEVFERFRKRVLLIIAQVAGSSLYAIPQEKDLASPGLRDVDRDQIALLHLARELLENAPLDWLSWIKNYPRRAPEEITHTEFSKLAGLREQVEALLRRTN
jgi:4-hydroxyphenylacetate 3-monooxygenase